MELVLKRATRIFSNQNQTLINTFHRCSRAKLEHFRADICAHYTISTFTGVITSRGERARGEDRERRMLPEVQSDVPSCRNGPDRAEVDIYLLAGESHYKEHLIRCDTL